MEELNEKKTKYFVIAIIILIILGVLLIVHFNNKEVVKGEKDSDATTTTEKVITTTKKRVNVEVEEPVKEVYKSVVDEENKLVYDYKLTDEILETDKIISKKVDLTDALKENNVIGLYDISLYDSNLVKKSVSNSLITIKIPLTDELKGYDEYKIIYINDKNEITDEKFDVKVTTDYIEFNTTHLSLFGIVGIKKEIVVDLTKATVDVKVNNEVVSEVTNILLDKDDKVELVINNIDDEAEYEVYYGLMATGSEEFEYQKYDGALKLEDAINYKLFVKVSHVENSKTFEIGNIGLYDEIFKYDMNEKIEEPVVIGKIESENETLYDYLDKDKNMNIVIDNITKETEVEVPVTGDTVEGGTDVSVGEEDSKEITNNSATISVNGNIYLVEKTDISKLQMTGHLYIDTAEDIVFAENEEKLELSNLYSLTIRSKEFMLNGNKYSYEYTPDGGLVIYLLSEKTEEIIPEEGTGSVPEGTEDETIVETTEEVIEDIKENKTIIYDSEDKEFKESFSTIFNGEYEVVIDTNEKDLIIEKVTTNKPEDSNDNSESSGTSSDQTVQQNNAE